MTRSPSLPLSLASAALTAGAVLAISVALVVAEPLSSSPVLVANTSAQAPTFDPTIEAIIRTATAQRLVTSGTLIAATLTRAALNTATVTPTSTTTLPPPFSTVDPCACLTPRPDSTECANVVATLHAGYRDAFASQTALARGTDTATPTPSGTPTPTPTVPTRTPTPLPTDEPTPSPRPTWTARVVIVTATPAARTFVWLPFAYLRRAARR